MRLSLRFVVPLLVALGIFAYAALPLVDRLMLRWFSRDLEVRANLIANTVEEPLQDLIRSGNRRRTSSSAACPSVASNTWYPSSSRFIRTESKIRGSSSTMRMVCLRDDLGCTWLHLA